MSLSFQERVSVFYETLEEHVAEIEMEEQQGGSVRLYFDSKDIRYCVFGLLNLYDGYRFSIPVFQSESAMVQALGFSGWLGPMRMLQPHQYEFLGALREPRSFRSKSREEFVQEFLIEVSYKRNIPPIRSMKPSELYSHVKRYVGSTYEAFKAFQFVIHDSDWRTRLKRMRDDGLLSLSLDDDLELQLTSAPEFKVLKRIIDDKRPRIPLNNFADTLALLYLMDSTRRFNTGKSSAIDVYYDTTSQYGSGGFFRDVVEDSGYSDRFRYWIGDKSFSVLKPASYFRFRAMFRPPASMIPQGIDGSEGIIIGRDELKRLRSEVEGLIKASKVAEDTLIPSLGTSLGEIVKNIEELSFFRHIWEKHSAEGDAQRILAELNLSQLGEQKFAKGVEGALAETLQTLERNTSDYKWLSALWFGLKEKEDILKLIGSRDLSQDFRLVRFSLPSDVLHHIQSVLGGLAGRVTELEREDALRSAIHSLYRALHADQGGQDEDSPDYREALYLSASLLWLVGMYDELLALLAKQSRLGHHSLRIMYVAALLKKMSITRQRERGLFSDRIGLALLEGKLNALREEFRTEKRSGNLIAQGELAVGLAYLIFEYWLSLGYWPSWRQGVGDKEASDLDERSKRLIEEAVTFSSEAHELYKDKDPIKVLYTVNQRLFYLVEGGAESRIPDMMMLARDLLRERERFPECWQYTYDDTLARYNHRLAFAEKRKSARFGLMREALRLSELAVKHSMEADGQILNYRDQVKAELDILERGDS